MIAEIKTWDKEKMFAPPPKKPKTSFITKLFRIFGNGD